MTRRVFYPPREDALRRLNEGYTLQGVQFMPHHSDGDFRLEGWVNLLPQGSGSNGEELVKDGMRTEGVANTPQQYLKLTNGK